MRKIEGEMNEALGFHTLSALEIPIHHSIRFGVVGVLFGWLVRSDHHHARTDTCLLVRLYLAMDFM